MKPFYMSPLPQGDPPKSNVPEGYVEIAIGNGTTVLGLALGYVPVSNSELAKLEAAETKLEKAIKEEAKTWTGGNRGSVFIALADLANRMGLSITKDDLWDASMEESKQND